MGEKLFVPFLLAAGFELGSPLQTIYEDDSTFDCFISMHKQLGDWKKNLNIIVEKKCEKQFKVQTETTLVHCVKTWASSQILKSLKFIVYNNFMII